MLGWHESGQDYHYQLPQVARNDDEQIDIAHVSD
jgi:hypothetical protein